MKPWVVQTWCVPPGADGAYVWRREDVIQTYLWPFDGSRPGGCFDASSRQRFGEVRAALPARPASPSRAAYEYERKGRATCS